MYFVKGSPHEQVIKASLDSDIDKGLMEKR